MHSLVDLFDRSLHDFAALALCANADMMPQVLRLPTRGAAMGGTPWVCKIEANLLRVLMLLVGGTEASGEERCLRQSFDLSMRSAHGPQRCWIAGSSHLRAGLPR
mmetsp:Transcript_146580/g.365518  ORF Transcript_146580/g.365518 Transcript_146580/m.365518 type:complete len:105 (-) Transcript_146580:175-489(-)